ncbi:organic cation/carnitine transporter 2-like [Aulostomus maculatus]
MRTYAESVAFLGQFGRFQKIVFFLLIASIVPNGFGAFTLVFVNAIPSHHCLVPDVNLTEDWRNAIIPLHVVDGKLERTRCSRYRLDVVRNLSARGYGPGDVNLTDLEQEECRDGWNYTGVYQSTIVSDYDMVCSNQWKHPFTTTVYFLGVLCGSFFAGQVSDRFGRKPVLFATMAVQTIFTFIQIFSVSWAMYTILLFINALGQMSNFVAALVLGAETLTNNVRVLYSSLGSNFGFAAGYMMLPVFAYFFRSWTSLTLALAVPGLVYIPLWWVIPESPRWLLSKGRVKEAEAIVRKAAKWNKVEAPRVIFEGYGVSKKMSSKESYSPLDLVRTSNIRITTVILCFVAFTLAGGYYGVSYNTAQLHADPYISCFISAAVELPAYISSWLALRFLSRRLSIIGCLTLAAVPLYLIQLIPQGLSYLSLTLEMLGKYALTTGFALMFAYTTELYPTVLRNTATGICNTVSRCGSCLTPYLLELSAWHKFLPYIILGTLAVLSAISALYLPETFGKPLPETMEQMHPSPRIKCPCTTRKQTLVPVVLLDSHL